MLVRPQATVNMARFSRMALLAVALFGILATTYAAGRTQQDRLFGGSGASQCFIGARA